METNELQVSRNIKSVRQRVGLTQEDVASKMGITKQTYLKIENKPFSISITKIQVLADILKCNIDEFFLQKDFTESEE